MQTSNTPLHLGLVLKAAPHTAATQPCCKLWIDFGPKLGVLTAAPPLSAEDGERLTNLLVAASPLPGPKQTANFTIHARLLLAEDHAGRAMALIPEHDGPLGAPINPQG